MKPIQDVENMQSEAIELFEAAGFMDAQTILDYKVSDITTELIKANNVLEIIDTEPNHAMVMQWLKPLEDRFGKKIIEDELEVDSSILIKPKEILNTPFAIPISEKFIQEHRIDLLELPSGNIRFLDEEHAITFLNNNEEEHTRYNVISDQSPSKLRNKTEEQSAELFGKNALTAKDPHILDKSRILKMETFRKEGSKVTPAQRSEEINLTKTTRKETNEGVSPKSRFYIKGVLHKSASRFKSGCHSFLLVNILILLSFAVTSLVLVDRDKFSWAVWAPLLAVLAILIYLSLAQRSSCPICNQKQFAPKRCLKHKNAHHWPLFGYMLPTAIHALLFKWFRCIFCGTSVRLKE